MSLSPERARSILSGFKDQRILVVGDLMLDRYVYGSVSRISPEAPVPIVKVTDEKRMPGGAANVAWNIVALGAKASMSGVLGRDTTGVELKRILARGRVSTAGMLTVGGHPTTLKIRIVAERQQVVRVDWEGHPRLGRSAVARYCRLLAREMRRATGVILDDYSKGVVNQHVVDAILREAKKAGIPVGLDPKFNRELAFSGLAVATPNRKEAYFNAGMKESDPHPHPLKDEPLLEAGRRLLKLWTPRLLIITLGAGGMLLMARGKRPIHVPTRAKAVFDVSGAGDTSIATCMLALAVGAAPVEAAELGNYAAGVVCGKAGTATCSQKELLASLE